MTEYTPTDPSRGAYPAVHNPYVGAVQPPGPGLRRPRANRGTRRETVVWATVGSILAVCAVVSIVVITTETGFQGLLTGAVLAAIPVCPVIATFLWLDRYEAEPRGLLALAFAWGAGAATLGALVINTVSVHALERAGGDVTLGAVLVAPVVEETLKGLGVVLIILLCKREFDGVVDGIVYAGLTGVGFAFVENVLYLGRSLQDENSATAFVFFLRCFMSPFSHPLFTAAIGIGLGLAVSSRRPAVKLLAPIAGWLVAVGLHAAWNLSAVSGLAGFTTAYVLVQLPVFVLFALLAVMARRREGRIIGDQLGVYAAAGWLNHGEVAMVRSLRGRREARDWARAVGGPAGRQAMAEFQEVASELAFLRDRMVRGSAAADAASKEYAMLTSLYALRRAFLANLPDPGGP